MVVNYLDLKKTDKHTGYGIYFRHCHRCKDIFETELKKKKICPKCELPRGPKGGKKVIRWRRLLGCQ